MIFCEAFGHGTAETARMPEGMRERPRQLSWLKLEVVSEQIRSRAGTCRWQVETRTVARHERGVSGRLSPSSSPVARQNPAKSRAASNGAPWSRRNNQNSPVAGCLGVYSVPMRKRRRGLLGEMNAIAVLLTTATIVSVVSPARAQSAGEPDYAGGRRAHVSISAGTGTAVLRITPVGSSEPIAECANYCEFLALPGRYTLDAQEREGEHHRIGFRVRRSSSFLFKEGDRTVRAVGASVGVIGSLSVMVGLGLILGNASLGDGAPPQTSAQHRASQVGIGMFLGGLLATPIGWIVFGQTARA